MSGDVDPNPRPVFPCSVCAGNVTWRGRSVQFCICSKWIYLKCPLLSLPNFRTLGSFHSWNCPPQLLSASSGDNTVTFSLDFSSLYICSIRPIWPSRLMQHSRPTLAYKPLIPLLPILYLLHPHSYHHLKLLAVSLHLQLPLLS